jgi:hypothetical protein
VCNTLAGHFREEHTFEVRGMQTRGQQEQQREGSNCDGDTAKNGRPPGPRNWTLHQGEYRSTVELH